MKLLIVSHSCVEPINQAFYARLEARTGWRVTILLPAAWRGEYGMRRAVQWHDFRGRLVPLPVLLSGNVPLHIYRARLGRILQRERPSAIYVHHEPYGLATFQTFLANDRTGNVPIGFYSNQNLRKQYPRPIARLERFVYERASFAIAVSRSVSEVLRQKGYGGPCEIVPYGIDTELYRPAAAKPRDASVGRSLVVGYVGRLSQEKGLDTLMTAMRLMDKKNVRAVIAGDGPAADELKRMASTLGLSDRVTWLGYVPHDQTAAVYQRMNVVVVPSKTMSNWKEQFGRVVIEALACGVPVVTSDSGELPRLVSATGGGWTFPEGNAAALAAVLLSLIGRVTELRERGDRGRTMVRQQFGIDAIAERFVASVERTVGMVGSRC